MCDIADSWVFIFDHYGRIISNEIFLFCWHWHVIIEVNVEILMHL